MSTAEGHRPGGEPFRVLLRRYRVAAALSQWALAARAALSTRAVGDRERWGTRRPYQETARRLADALNLGPAARPPDGPTLRPVAATAAPESPTVGA